MWLTRAYTDLDRLAEKNWEALRRQANLPFDGWEMTRLSRRDDPQISSITHRVSHAEAGQFAYKFQLRPQSPDGFAQHYRHQQETFERFPHSAGFTVPRPVFLDAQRQVSLVEYVDGLPVSEVLQNTPSRDKQLEILAKCGAWLDVFHRCEFETRNFRPKHTLRYYGTLRHQIETGEKSVPARSLFLQGIVKLMDVAPQYAGIETIAAIQHGDFHLRNLIWRDGQIAGLDMSKGQVAPVGYDIAKILLDFTSVFRSDVPLQDGQIVHSDTKEAFFQGYRLVGVDDPSVNFLLYARILATLHTVPAAQCDRTDAKQRTLRRLRPIAKNAFGGGDIKHLPQAKTDKSVVFLLTKNSLERARQGEHEFSNAVSAALKPLGYKVAHRRNTPHNRARLDAGDLTLVHMSDPIGENGLVFRRAYAGPFWHLERRAERWKWDIARKPFSPESIDAKQAKTFFEHWCNHLLPEKKYEASQAPFVYMPLQGKLLKRRSFQRTSPMGMIKTTLQQTDLQIKATLHPTEEYSEEEMSALRGVGRAHARFQLVELPMHDALSACTYVVTENSSAAFHAILYEKPSILFADVDFHHICEAFDPENSPSAFEKVSQPARPFRKYLFWYWAMNCIDISSPNAHGTFISRMTDKGWRVTK